jgi:L,D-transpeptidase catalytic domain
MMKRLLPAILTLLGAVAVGVTLVLIFKDEDETNAVAGAPGQPRETVAPESAPGAVVAPESVRVPVRSKPRGPVPTLAAQPPRRPNFAILAVRDGAHVPLYARPGGALVRQLSARSEFGSPRVLAVAKRRGPWIGVITPLRPDGELGWVRFDAAKLELYWTRYAIKVLLSDRRMELRYAGRLVDRFVVTVGAAGSDTPPGRFAITDALDFGASPFYGCCALALSGHQSKLPPGWLGGDRLAIHGTPGPVGYAASHGCIRATDATMRTLFRRIPLGTPVFVEA